MSKPIKPDHEFRSLPTPEQIRAHGEGGLWDTKSGHYRLWDRPRNTPINFDVLAVDNVKRNS